MAAVTIFSDSGAQEKKVLLFPLFPHLFAMKWWHFPGGSVVKNLPANAGHAAGAMGWISGLGRSSEGGNGNYSSILAWRIPRREEPGRLQFIGLQRVGHDWACMRGLQPTRLLCPWGFYRQNTGVGSHFLLPGIFPTQGSYLCFLRLQVASLHQATREALTRPVGKFKTGTEKQINRLKCLINLKERGKVEKLQQVRGEKVDETPKYQQFMKCRWMKHSSEEQLKTV